MGLLRGEDVVDFGEPHTGRLGATGCVGVGDSISQQSAHFASASFLLTPYPPPTPSTLPLAAAVGGLAPLPSCW